MPYLYAPLNHHAKNRESAEFNGNSTFRVVDAREGFEYAIAYHSTECE